jgi:hypothetical protein
MPLQDPDKLIRVVQDSTKNLLHSFRDKDLAIDGTESQDQQLDMMIFYAGAFGYIGKLHFTDSQNGCTFDEPLPIEGSLGLSTAVSIHEQDSILYILYYPVA